MLWCPCFSYTETISDEAIDMECILSMDLAEKTSDRLIAMHLLGPGVTKLLVSKAFRVFGATTIFRVRGPVSSVLSGPSNFK